MAVWFLKSFKSLKSLQMPAVAALSLSMGLALFVPAETAPDTAVQLADASPKQARKHSKRDSSSETLESRPRLKEVLDPDKMFGEVRIAYMAAKRIPDIASHLFCYCGCDESDGHTSLLDCYTSRHGMDCSICTGEIMLALRLNTEGKPLREIQRQVDREFAGQYPLQDATDALKKYRASLGEKALVPLGGDAHRLASKAGFQEHGCCGHQKK